MVTAGTPPSNQDEAARVGGSRRRAAYAETTRQAIIQSARTLFADQGYFTTKVEQIADHAHVAPKTVYSVVGGKQGVLHILAHQWIEAPVVSDGLRRLPVLRDAREVLAVLSRAVRSQFEDHGDVIRILSATAPHESVAAEVLESGTRRIRADLRVVARHLQQLDGTALHPGVDRTTDILWFYFGLTSYPLLVEASRWSPADAESWLLEQALSALTSTRSDVAPGAAGSVLRAETQRAETPPG